MAAPKSSKVETNVLACVGTISILYLYFVTSFNSGVQPALSSTSIKPAFSRSNNPLPPFVASLGIPIFTGSLDDFDEHPVSNVVATKPAVKNVLNNLFVFIMLFPLFYL